MQHDLTSDFELVYRELHQAAYRVAFRLVADREMSADIAQEAVLRAYVRWSKVAPYAVPWVSRTAANLALDELRRRRRRRPALVVGGAGVDPPGLGVDLSHAVAALPKRQREVVVLRYVADLSERDVAAQLGISVGAVKTHASRGLKALGHSLEEHAHDPAHR